MTVSYTHLDVYKRQRVHLRPQHNSPLMRHLTHMVLPVSYTHLDVYKRQAAARLGFQCAAAFLAFDDAELADWPDKGLVVAPYQEFACKQIDERHRDHVAHHAHQIGGQDGQEMCIRDRPYPLRQTGR